jgi:arsenate reductase (thioredoxin)
LTKQSYFMWDCFGQRAHLPWQVVLGRAPSQQHKDFVMSKPKVLFLCTGNSARSQMAEGLLRAMAGDYFDVFSAGTEPKGKILPEVKEVMREIGIDISSQRSKSVMEYMGRHDFGYVITVCSDAEENCPAVFLNMGTHVHWPLDDPAKFDEEERLASTRSVRYQIELRLRLWLTAQGISPRDYRQKQLSVVK